MSFANYHRVFPALFGKATPPRSPHVVSDICSLLKDRDHTVTVSSIDLVNGRFDLTVDGIVIEIRAGPSSGNSWTDLWYHVHNAAKPSQFVRVNAASVLDDVPFRFVDSKGFEVYPMQRISESWHKVWPRRDKIQTWDEYAKQTLHMDAQVVETRRLVYVDEWSFVHAIELILHM